MDIKDLISASCADCGRCVNCRCTHFNRPVQSYNKCIFHTRFGIKPRKLENTYVLLRAKIAEQEKQNKWKWAC